METLCQVPLISSERHFLPRQAVHNLLVEKKFKLLVEAEGNFWEVIKIVCKRDQREREHFSLFFQKVQINNIIKERFSNRLTGLSCIRKASFRHRCAIFTIPLLCG